MPPRTPPRPHYQRARTDSEKLQRRETILAAADAHLRSAGFEAFSMGVLAKKAGIAKGTLYLYFETREEVLLSLYADQLAVWGHAMESELREGMTDDAFLGAFLATATADPAFLDLTSRLGSVIEHNVSIERLIESKRMMRGVLVPVAERLERCLALDPGAGIGLLTSLTSLLLGASQIDAGPSLENEDVPADVAAMVALFSCKDVFLTHAPLLLAGLRQGLA